MSGSMAYLVGGRYLQWLEDEFGKDKLDAVWTRMQAVKKRNFEEAFEGVYNEKAGTLYRRFVAEYTYQAIALEKQQTALETNLWLDLEHVQSAPVLSPDESKIAIVRRDKDDHRVLTLYSTADNQEALEEF